MKTKTAITLSEELLLAVNQKIRSEKKRSVIVEQALKSYLANLARPKQNARDLEIINLNAERLNQEAEDVLNYQVRF